MIVYYSMGLNAYFTYNVVGYHGSGKVSYQTAVAAVLIEGCIFLVLSIFGIRQWLARVIPMSIKVAMGCGIGLYLCFIGLQSSAGIGIVGLDKSTLVALGMHCSAFDLSNITHRSLYCSCMSGPIQGCRWHLYRPYYGESYYLDGYPWSYYHGSLDHVSCSWRHLDRYRLYRHHILAPC